MAESSGCGFLGGALEGPKRGVVKGPLLGSKVTGGVVTSDTKGPDVIQPRHL